MPLHPRHHVTLACLAALAVGAVPAAAQEDAFSLTGLIVTASPTPRPESDVAANVTVLSGEELRALGDRALSEALRSVPGVDVVRGGSFGATTSLFLRGGESDYTLVLVDGVQVNQAGGGFDFSTLTTDNVERVEIVRGPASALYGSDAVAGVIHVITRTGRGPVRGTVSVRTGSFGHRDVSLSGSGGTASAAYSLSLSREAGDGILPRNNRHATSTLSARAQLRPDDRTELSLALRSTGHEFHFPTDGSGAVVDDNAFTFADAVQAQLTLRRAVGRRLTLQALVGVADSDGGTDDQPDTPADTLGFFGFTSLDDFRRTHGELRANLALPDGIVTGGVEIERERQRSFSESLSEFGPSGGRSGSERDNRAGFLHATGTVGAFALSGGARLESNERFGRFATWQAGVSWLTHQRLGTRVRAAAGRALKEPTFLESFATGFAVGNPDLDPERSRSWEVGVEQPLAGDAATVRATYYAQRFEDLIQYTFSPPSPGDPSYFNVAEARARGIELEADARFGPISAGVTASWLDTEVLDAGFDTGPGATFVEGESLLRRPETKWSLRAGADVAGGARLHARLTRVGSRADRDFSTFPASPVTLPAHLLLAAGLEWTVPSLGSAMPDLGLTLLGENLLDEAYEEALGFRAPGRALYVGLRVGVGGGG